MEKQKQHFALYITNKTERQDDNCPHCGARGRYVTYVMCSDGKIRGAMRGCLKGAFILDEKIEQHWSITKQLRKSPKWFTGKRLLVQIEDEIYKKAQAYNSKYGIEGLPARVNLPEPIPANTRTGTAVEGRDIIKGTVQKIKVYGNEDIGFATKMIVLDERDFAVFGSMPSNIANDVKVGDKVQFNATVHPSPNDTTFGFYKRPLKAQIVS